jgi:hypothetical protein
MNQIVTKPAPTTQERVFAPVSVYELLRALQAMNTGFALKAFDPKQVLHPSGKRGLGCLIGPTDPGVTGDKWASFPVRYREYFLTIQAGVAENLISSETRYEGERFLGWRGFEITTTESDSFGPLSKRLDAPTFSYHYG